MKSFLLTLILLIISTKSFAKNGIEDKIYECNLSSNAFRSVSMANQAIKIPLSSYPAVYSGMMDEVCKIKRNNVDKNPEFITNECQSFLLKVATSISKKYNQFCRNQFCERQFDCKVFSKAVTSELMNYLDENISRQGCLIEIKEPILQLITKDVKDSKPCLNKLNGFFGSRKLSFYKYDHCISKTYSKQQNYISILTASENANSWNQTFKSCISNLSNYESENN